MPNPLRCLVFLAVLPAAAWAAETDPVAAPQVKVGDSWVFDQVEEKGQSGFDDKRIDLSIQELGGDGTMTVGIKRDGAPIAAEARVVGTDWSRRRLVDGQQTVSARPFQFPLSIGRSWHVDFVDNTRYGNQLSNRIHRTYTVVGWEDVTVPAGHFRALKIQENGVDEGTLEVPGVAGSAVAASPTGSTAISHAQRGGIGKLARVTHEELYYVPAVKYYVKWIEEQYNADNVRVWRQTQNLISFTPAG